LATIGSVCPIALGGTKTSDVATVKKSKLGMRWRKIMRAELLLDVGLQVPSSNIVPFSGGDCEMTTQLALHFGRQRTLEPAYFHQIPRNSVRTPRFS
jgi:hypothetical protein